MITELLENGTKMKVNIWVQNTFFSMLIYCIVICNHADLYIFLNVLVQIHANCLILPKMTGCSTSRMTMMKTNTSADHPSNGLPIGSSQCDFFLFAH